MKSSLFEVFKAMSVIVIKDEIKTLVFVNLSVLSLQRVRELLEKKFLLSLVQLFTTRDQWILVSFQGQPETQRCDLRELWNLSLSPVFSSKVPRHNLSGIVSPSVFSS